ncbi:MAG TPA: excinuclease ABC subunit UvrC [Xanthobacteraceae bacterium]|nr:excinuclease ABC subunit UvrC [Xanthobacteraceae bacterium]
MIDPKKANIDPAVEPDIPPFEDEEGTLPEIDEQAESAENDLAEDAVAAASGRDVIARFAKLAPSSPGVYRMAAANGDVLYVGKAKNIKKRILAYARPTGHVSRIARMIAATSTMEFVSTATETEALLLEANLIKRLRPRFNVLLRDDKSFPYILLTADHPSPQLCKHRGARNRKGDYFGPFASVWAVNRTITALERAFLVRSCSDTIFESRTRPCLLHQIKRCAAPCTGEVTPEAYEELVREARAFLSGRSRVVKDRLATEMEAASNTLDFERAAVLRDLLAALSAIQSQQGINLRGVDEADVFAAHQNGGYTCIEVFFFRAGQNWGNRAYFPKADRSLTAAEVLGEFLAQFYDDKPCPRTILLSHTVADQALLGEALSIRSNHKVDVLAPQRGEKKLVVDHAAANAREALGRKLADTASQQRLLEGLTAAFGLPRVPSRIEVYDNSHIQGSNAVGGMVVAGPEGFRKNQYRKFNIKSESLTPGDDYAMMREVLTRRFKRLMNEAPRVAEAAVDDKLVSPGDSDPQQDDNGQSPWPDLVLIDGGEGQLTAVRQVFDELGIDNVALVAISKGPDRDAGRETFHMPGRAAFRLPARDPVLYFVQRLRDEVHRFAIGSHRQKRRKDIREAGLQEISGIGPGRKRALLRHFGTLKAIERASVADLSHVPGINAETARRIYDFFHDQRQ